MASLHPFLVLLSLARASSLAIEAGPLGRELFVARRAASAVGGLLAAGGATGEEVWPLPLLEAHKDGMKGKSADLSNIGSPAMGAGPSQGAAFLSHFVAEGREWAHLDIAGTAWNTQDRDWVGGSMGTGVGARLLVEFLKQRA